MALTDESSGIKVEKKIHPGWLGLENARERRPDIKQIFGKHQYLFTKGENAISLIKLSRLISSISPWEIYQTKGKQELFEDVERFKSKDEAIIRIKELFNE